MGTIGRRRGIQDEVERFRTNIPFAVQTVRIAEHLLIAGPISPDGNDFVATIRLLKAFPTL
jgi:hypothetical protein